MFSRGLNPYIQIEDLCFDSASCNPDYSIPLNDVSSRPLLRRHTYSRSDTVSPHPNQDCLAAPQHDLSRRTSSNTLKALPRIPGLPSLAGWRFTVTTGCAITIVVLIANVALLAWAHPKLESPGGNALLFSGDCDEMKKVDTWSHFGINVLSTLLLGASNGAMQCLVAPSREDIDRTHPRGGILDIGVNGVANWSNMGWRRRCIWCALLASTLPLHLFYNSVIFSSTSAVDFTAILGTDNFLHGANFSAAQFNNAFFTQIESDLQKNISVPGALTNLSNSDCIDAFGSTFVSNYLRVAIIVEGAASNGTIINRYTHSITSVPSDLSWLCGSYPGSDCDFSPGKPDRSNWVFANPIDKSLPVTAKYCLAQPVIPSCTVELFPGLLYTVIICNIIKAICFICLIFTRFDPLITMGDAIASFLERPDPTTAGLGAMSARDVRGKWIVAGKGTEYWEELNKDRVWKNKRYYWFSGASPLRWLGVLCTCTAYWMVGLALLVADQKGSNHASFQSEWAAGLGSILPSSLASHGGNGARKDNPASIIKNVLLANFPQVVLSLVYIQYNGLFTCMLLSREWASYASNRKGLRTSIPQGSQRSTYWLSLPYKFSVPLLVASGLLHWLLSQSIFFAQVNVLDSTDTPATNSISTVGWSGLSLALLVVLGGTMIATISGFGFMRYAPGIPIVSSNSRAISAACHPLPGHYSESMQRVQYGVLAEYGEGKGHVGFSGRDVSPLVDGHVYT